MLPPAPACPVACWSAASHGVPGGGGKGGPATGGAGASEEEEEDEEGAGAAATMAQLAGPDQVERLQRKRTLTGALALTHDLGCTARFWRSPSGQNGTS